MSAPKLHRCAAAAFNAVSVACGSTQRFEDLDEERRVEVLRRTADSMSPGWHRPDGPIGNLFIAVVRATHNALEESGSTSVA